MSLQVVMAPDIRRPGLISPEIPRYEYPDLNLDELVKGLGKAYETYQYQRGLEEARPAVEEQTETTSRQATPVEQQKAADYTQDVFNREEEDWLEGITDPEEREKERQSYRETLNQGLTRPGEEDQPVQWVDPQASVKQTQTTYKVGNETFYNRPSQEMMDFIELENLSRFYQDKDPRLALQYRDEALQRRTNYVANQWEKIASAQDEEAAVRFYNDIPDGMGARIQRGDDGTVQLLRYPDGQPDKAEVLFQTKDKQELFKFIAQDVDAVTWQKTAWAQQDRDYRQGRDREQDARNARTDERYARSEARYDRQELLNQAESLENMAKEQAVFGNYEEAAKMKREADALRRQVHGQVSAGGLGGPVQGAAPASGETPEYLNQYQEQRAPGPQVMRWLPTIEEEIARQGVDIDPLWVLANLRVESNGQVSARSNKGAQGLMQLIDSTARRFGVTDPNDPVQNIKGGVAYMALLKDMFGGDLRLATAAYNAGEGAVQKYGNQIPPFPETQNHVKQVLGTYNTLRNGLQGPQPSSQGLTAPPNQPPAAPPPAPNQPQQGLTAQADDYALRWAKAQGKKLTPDQALKLEEEAIMLAQAETPDFGRLSPDAQEQLVAKARQKILAAHAAWNNGGQAGAAAATMTPEQRMKMFTDNLDKILEVVRAQKSK